MRYFIYLFFIISFLSCTKDETSTYTDFQETLIKAESSGWGINESHFDINIDKADSVDIKITAVNYHYHFYSGSYIQVECYNDYEIAFDTSNGNILPKEYYLGDTIEIDKYYTGNPLKIDYLYVSWSPVGTITDTLTYGISSNIYLYIVFRKQSGNKNILAWLKLKIIDSTSIILNSCNYIINQDIFIIE